MNKKYVFIASIFIIFLLTTSVYAATRRTDLPQEEEKPGVAMQFVQSFSCILTECGWPAIVILILPAIAVYIYKKFFSLF